MASDNHAHYSKIGFAVLLGTAAIVATLIWLGGVRGDDEPVFVETCYDKPVTGLSVGSTVNFRGVPVGKVALIDFIGNHYEGLKDGENTRIYIKMALNRKSFHGVEFHGITPEAALKRLVDSGLRATVSASGVTGLSHIELNFPKGKVSVERPSWKSDNIVIPSAPSILQSVADSATQILDQINRMDLLAAWTNAVSTLEGANATIGTFGTLLESNGGNIGEILDNLREASSSLRDFANEIKANPAALLRSSDPERLPETR